MQRKFEPGTGGVWVLAATADGASVNVESGVVPETCTTLEPLTFLLYANFNRSSSFQIHFDLITTLI